MKNNQIYYFEIAKGTWEGRFEFYITNFSNFWRSSISLTNRALALANYLFNKIFGKCVIVSSIAAFPEEGAAGVARSRVWVRKFMVTMYRMRGHYVLADDGVQVEIRIHEQFGPVPFLFRHSKSVTAEIGNGGMSSTYHMPLLGGTWTGQYQVSPDRNHVTAVYESTWGRAKETIHRIS